MLETVPTLDKFFDAALEDLPCNPDTRAYIVSVFTKFAKTSFDLPSPSITLTFFYAKQHQDFATYQSLGDWIFFCSVEFPEHLANASDDYYRTVGQLSYLSCYKLLKRQWKCFDELAERFDILEKETRNLLTSATLIDTELPPQR